MCCVSLIIHTTPSSVAFMHWAIASVGKIVVCGFALALALALCFALYFCPVIFALALYFALLLEFI